MDDLEHASAQSEVISGTQFEHPNTYPRTASPWYLFDAVVHAVILFDPKIGK
jgi:hypothetical protein